MLPSIAGAESPSRAATHQPNAPTASVRTTGRTTERTVPTAMLPNKVAPHGELGRYPSIVPGT